MDHRDHVALIRAGVTGAGPRWLGARGGEGAFTLALADLLGPGGDMIAWTATHRRSPGTMEARKPGIPGRPPSRRRRPATSRKPSRRTSSTGSSPPTASTSWRTGVPSSRRSATARRAGTGRFVLVEYDADHGNPWVPHPFSFATWRRDSASRRLREPALIHRVPSRFLGAIYGAVTMPRTPSGSPGAVTAPPSPG